MPDQRDPIRDLEEFGSMTVTPIPPSEIRRLGDRRRTRRRSAVVVAASALAAVAISVPVALTRGGESADGTENIATTSASPTPTPTPTPTPDITYPGNGIELTSPADVDRLTGTSAVFKTFMAEQVRLAVQDGQACPGAAAGITVKKYGADRYASGGVNACGGFQALWAVRDGSWELGYGTQDAADCDILRYYDIPKSFVDNQCYDESGAFGPDSVSEITLGMTEQQVQAAGGKVTDSPGGEACLGVQLPYQREPSGTYSPTRGVVSLTALPGMKTQNRIGLGTLVAKVRQLYPDLRESDGYQVAQLGPDRQYAFLIENGMVTQMMLSRPDLDCLQ